MSRVKEILDRIWFPPVHPMRLAVVRILTGLFTLWYLFRHGRWLSGAPS